MTGNGTIVWAIDNFEIRFRQAVNGIEPILQSEPAQTGPYGYKFRSLVYLNGDAKAKGILNLRQFVPVTPRRSETCVTTPCLLQTTFAPLRISLKLIGAYTPAALGKI